jgi:hypothetical protein
VTKPKIYVFCNGCAMPDWHEAMAIAEDGHVLAGHACSDHGFIAHDMGVTSKRKHDKYDAHYPEGWELVLVEGDPRDHAGLAQAFDAHAALTVARARAAEPKP